MRRMTVSPINLDVIERFLSKGHIRRSTRWLFSHWPFSCFRPLIVRRSFSRHSMPIASWYDIFTIVLCPMRWHGYWFDVAIHTDTDFKMSCHHNALQRGEIRIFTIQCILLCVTFAANEIDVYCCRHNKDISIRLPCKRGQITAGVDERIPKWIL